MDEDVFWEYCCKDAVITYEVAEQQKKALKDLQLEEQFTFQMALHEPVFEMNNRGVLVDLHERTRMTNLLIEMQLEREGWFYRTVGSRVGAGPKASPWFRSNPQLQTLFYKWMKIPPVLDRATKRPTTKAQYHSIIWGREPLAKPILQKLEEYRSLGVFLNNFCRAKLWMNRIMTTYNIDGTETFRFSSNTNPFDEGTNLQNVPPGHELEEL